MDAVSDHRSDAAERGQFIPVRKSELQHALSESGTWHGKREQAEFSQLCRMLAAVFHYEYFDRLERLRDCYFYFNPEHDGHTRYDAAAVERAYREMVDAFHDVLKGANFVEVTRE